MRTARRANLAHDWVQLELGEFLRANRLSHEMRVQPHKEGQMKTYVSRREAAQKYKVSIAKLRRWEEKGALRRIDAKRAEPNTKRAGTAVQWVYDEEQLRALVEALPSKHIVPRNRETEVFELLNRGRNVIEIACQTKLPVKEVQRLRDTYLYETKGLYLPPHIVARMAEMRVDIPTAEAVAATMERLYKIARQENIWRMEAEKLGKVQVAPRTRVQVIHDPHPFDDSPVR